MGQMMHIAFVPIAERLDQNDMTLTARRCSQPKGNPDEWEN